MMMTLRRVKKVIGLIGEKSEFLGGLILSVGLLLFAKLLDGCENSTSLSHRQELVVFLSLPKRVSDELLPLFMDECDFKIYRELVGCCRKKKWMKNGLLLFYQGSQVFFHKEMTFRFGNETVALNKWKILRSRVFD